MSLLSRLFRRSRPVPTAPDRGPPATPVAPPPKPDPSATAREEEAAIAQAVAAGDAAAVGRWVLEGGSTRTRQFAAQAIADPDQLRELIRLTRGKDKNVYRILTAKREALLAADRAAQQRQAEIDAAAAAIARHADRPCDAAYAASLGKLEARWQSLAPQAAPELQQEVAKQITRCRESIDEHRRAVAAEAERQRTVAESAAEARRQREIEAQATAAAVAAREQEAEAERAAQRARHEAQDAELRRLAGLLRQAQAALEHGGTARAVRLRDAINDSVPTAPPLPAWFERKRQELDARIAELRDWNTFTVVPKRAQLVQRMQSLIGADMSPEELARQVRRLRDEWRTLHRGAAEESSAEREQFEAAAERAYEPCRAHFARQAEQRKENQARREGLLERLSTFVSGQSGDTVDWRLVQQVLAEARREWRTYAPVDQDVIESLQERFHAVTGGLQARLDDEYARNVEAKRRLVARAAELTVAGSTREAIEETKNLQRAWKNAGLVPRRQDNELWAEFRKHCDAVFERSTQESAAYSAALEANQARAIELCEEVERIPALEGDELQAGLRQLPALRAEFEALELPRTSARDLGRRFLQGAERCDAAARRHRDAAARRAWSDLFATAARVRAYALAKLEPRAPDEAALLRGAAESAIAGLTEAPRAARDLLEQQLVQADAGAVGSDLGANEAALRLLCVRAELLADLPTPEEDLDLRREYQMQRLVASMGRGERISAADFDDLALEWLAVGPTEPAAHDALLARFARCRANRAG